MISLHPNFKMTFKSNNTDSVYVNYVANNFEHRPSEVILNCTSEGTLSKSGIKELFYILDSMLTNTNKLNTLALGKELLCRSNATYQLSSSPVITTVNQAVDEIERILKQTIIQVDEEGFLTDASSKVIMAIIGKSLSSSTSLDSNNLGREFMQRAVQYNLYKR